MLKHYLTLAFRTLFRNKFHAGINILGLAVGMACSLVIMLFVYGEWSYDRGYAKSNRIYRIGISFFNIGTFANGPERTLEILPKEFSGIETGTRLRKERDVIFQIKDKVFKEFAYYTDTAYFKLFDHTFAAGDAARVLSGPNEIVLTEKMAIRLLGKPDALGETVLVGKDKTPHQVTGIVRDLDFNTHLNSGIWLSIQPLLKNEPAWTSAAFHTYVLLREGSSKEDLQAAVENIIDNHVFPESGKPMGFKTLEDYKKNDMAVKFYVQPLKDIYLKSKLNAELMAGGNESNIYIFSAISLFILLLAAVNFVNLTTARATRRAREVGIRKTMGTSRTKLAGQFLLESIITSSIALVFAIFLSEVFLAIFEYITGTPLLTTLWRNPVTLPFFIGFSVVVGFLSGIYPAFYLTSFMPVKVLKGQVNSDQGIGFRNFLVVFQFTVSIALIVCALAVRQQLQFIQTKDLGFDQQNVLTVDGGRNLKTSAEAFKNELANQPGVVLSSFHTGEPGSKRILTFYTWQTASMDHPITINTYFGDESYLPLCGIRLIKGRNFSGDLASDSSAVILNEAAVKALGLPADAIGAVLNEKQKVIGIVSDFHWESLRNTIQPVAFVFGKDPIEIGFKLEANAIPGFLKLAEAKWKQLAADEPFKYHFLDDNFAELLNKEAVFGKAINIFTMIAIFISCLGLYGLAAHTTERRTKEIGIRKVLGATVSQIAKLLSKEFLLLVAIAFVIASPLAWYATKQWLEGFAYRTDIGLWMFGITALLAFVVAMVTLGYQTISAANQNPVESLRSE